MEDTWNKLRGWGVWDYLVPEAQLVLTRLAEA